MASNLDNKYITGDTLSSILSQTVTKLNNKINDIPEIVIGDNGNFIIKGKDTGVLAKGLQGKTLTKIEVDSNNNVIITTNDGITSNIGNLTTTVSGGIASEQGLGNVRYYNNKFQYWYNRTWVDIVMTDDNKLATLLIPQDVKEFSLKYSYKANKTSLRLTLPSDTEINGNTICRIKEAIIRRKKDSEPKTITDGEEVLTLGRDSFKKYRSAPYIDETFDGVLGDIWYYKVFIVSESGLINSNTVKKIEIADVLYGFTIDQNESDPDSMITYIETNSEYAPAHMDYTTDKFDYGDWEDVWFIDKLKPVMLNYDGTVAYELDKNDYSKKKDGTPSNISDLAYEGNAMIGIPKVYYKIENNEDGTISVRFSDRKVDEDYCCYAHLDNNGNEMDYCYMATYNGYIDSDNKLRSISGAVGSYGKTTEQFVTYSKNNNTNPDIWNITIWSDKVLITLLSILIGKSMNTQKTFGQGYTGNSADYSMVANGVLDSKGLFYGTNTTLTPVKIFGIENFWGNFRYRIAGLVTVSGVPKVKMTYGKQDGSTVEGYNLTGEGYVSLSGGITSSGYIKKMLWSQYGFYPSAVGGSATTYYCDYYYHGSNGYAVAYSWYGSGAISGIFDLSTYWGNTYSSSGQVINATLSCKPLATTTSTSET